MLSCLKFKQVVLSTHGRYRAGLLRSRWRLLRRSSVVDALAANTIHHPDPLAAARSWGMLSVVHWCSAESPTGTLTSVVRCGTRFFLYCISRCAHIVREEKGGRPRPERAGPFLLLLRAARLRLSVHTPPESRAYRKAPAVVRPQLSHHRFGSDRKASNCPVSPKKVDDMSGADLQVHCPWIANASRAHAGLASHQGRRGH
jgi:hypothetical protein